MKSKAVFRACLLVLAGAVGLWLGVRFLLPVLLPFLIALLIAKLAQPIIRFLQQKGRLPRWLAAGLTVAALFTLLGLAVAGLVRTLWGEVAQFTKELPQLMQSVAEPMGRLKQWLLEWANRVPDSVGDALRSSIDSFFKNGSVLADKAYSWLFSLASSTISGLPDMFLFVVTMVISSFMLASQYESLWAFFRRQLPAAWKNKYEAVVTGLRSTLVAWLKAQLKLIGVTFVLMTCGMMLLNVGYPLLFGALIALIDALPLFGTGTILLPWGALSFLRGDTRLGIGLVLLYGAAYLARSTLEPRLVGKQVGMNPLLTLVALYAGYQLVGVVGMIVFPIGAVLIKQFWDYTVPKKRSA